MVSKTIQEQAEEINWWHSIKLSEDYTTKGRVGADHCSSEAITNRFGMPLDMTGKTVLDVGTFDGLMAFEAEKRGAKEVAAIDLYQGSGENSDGFHFAKAVLKSQVEFDMVSIESFNEHHNIKYDIVLLYGTIYHVDNPIQHLHALSNLCKEYALIETAIAQTNYGDKSVWEFNYGFDNDETNKWYPTLNGLKNVLKYVGFKSVELIYNNGIRATVKAIK
jgi:2-polyprenyl-3-methyl-5-hydroxy-6-metoxy-1,4-benzoquinol methylase